MAEIVDTKGVVKHLANGLLHELCLICLTAVEDDKFENIFTVIYKNEREYCIADALETVCQFKFDGTEKHVVCIECFKTASAAYKFYLQAQRSMEIITFYSQELINNIQNVEVTDEDTEKLLCIPLSDFVPETQLFDFNLEGIGQKLPDNDEEMKDTKEKELIVLVENGKMSYYELKPDGTLKRLQSEDDDDDDDDEEIMMIVNEKKVRKKREKMMYIKCSKCDVKYRFLSKLKDHMKNMHNIDMYYCKICKMTSTNKEEYDEHVKTHIFEHQCTICNAVYKKSETLTAHMKLHETGKLSDRSENANICEQCGAILEDETSLQEHIDTKHMSKYTCYYCGRLYRAEASFDKHIRKHEQHWKKKKGVNPVHDNSSENEQDKSKRSICATCGKDFVDERSLLWHQRLHNNDRPYKCEVCGRAFVSKNRRNQHALCAHTPPARRCPLCPALFHLRSMVNSHVKKVHLKTHKRRSRTTKHQNVFWRTEAVPIQELSVDVQSDILELQESRYQQTENESFEANGSMIYT